MKNYIVKALINFDDMEEKNELGANTPRKANQSIWHCTKERYEYLKSRGAVMLVGIDKEEEKIEDGTSEHPYETVKPISIEETKDELLEDPYKDFPTEKKEVKKASKKKSEK